MQRHAKFLLSALVASLCSSCSADSTNTTAIGVTVAGGLFHTCLIVVDFSLRCFGGGNSDAVASLAPTGSVEKGFGNFGQIGSGDNETLGDEEGEMSSALAAVDLGINTVHDVAAGQSHTCVVLGSGGVACFGYNYYGQLGMGGNTSRGLLPSDMGENLALVDLGADRTATRVGSGHHHTCAVLEDGSLKCWGKNNKGMLGLGHTSNRGDSAGEMGDDLPTIDLGTGRTAVSVAGGRYHTCALLDNATLKCWGGGNSTGLNYGQLGQGNTLDIGTSEGQMGDALPAIDLGTNRTVVAFDLGWDHTCALLDDGSLRCFGRNFDGQLGLGDTEDRGDEPGEMGNDLPVVDLGANRYAVGITCGRWHTCVLLDNGDVKCFGANSSDDLGAGQLGLEDSENRGQTVDTTGDGLNAVELGTGRTSGWIFAAFDHTCVIFNDAQVKCWGLNASGQLGLGHTYDVGAEEGTMGDALPAVQPGLRLAFPPSPTIIIDGGSSPDDSTPSPPIVIDKGSSPGYTTPSPTTVIDEGSSSTDTTPNDKASASSNSLSLLAFAVVVAFALVACIFMAKRLRCAKKGSEEPSGDGSSIPGTPGPRTSGWEKYSKEFRSGNVEVACWWCRVSAKLPSIAAETIPLASLRSEKPSRVHRLLRFLARAEGTQDYVLPVPLADTKGTILQRTVTGRLSNGNKTTPTPSKTPAVPEKVYGGWDVVKDVGKSIPWLQMAFSCLDKLVEIMKTKSELEGRFKKIETWASSLQVVIVEVSQRIKMKQGVNVNALRDMSTDATASLEELHKTITKWNKKGELKKYVMSPLCKTDMETAETALRSALLRLNVVQAAELIRIVNENSEQLRSHVEATARREHGISEQLRRQEEATARLEQLIVERI